MKFYYKIFIFIAIFSFSLPCIGAETEKKVESTKKERNQITKGNKLYEEGKFKDALEHYKKALEENPSSVVGKYNLGLTEIRIGDNKNDTTAAAKKMLEEGMRNMQQIANMGQSRPDLASKANYNLGNLSYQSEDYQKAIDFYKQSLRLNPNDENARRNLRLAQLKKQEQDQNQDQNQDQQDQEDQQDKEDQQEQQDQQDQQDNQDNQDQQDQQNQDQQEQQENQPQSALNPQTAEQILNAIENKENQTRAKVAGQNAEKSRQRNKNKRNW